SPFVGDVRLNMNDGIDALRLTPEAGTIKTGATRTSWSRLGHDQRLNRADDGAGGASNCPRFPEKISRPRRAPSAYTQHPWRTNGSCNWPDPLTVVYHRNKLRRRAAEKRDERAAPHVGHLGVLPPLFAKAMAARLVRRPSRVSRSGRQ